MTDTPTTPTPFPFGTPAGNWTGGCIDIHGQPWRHYPLKGWQKRGQPVESFTGRRYSNAWMSQPLSRTP